ncbi:hypothetical protein C7474_0200 [Microbacterium telephonicum]|uniref:Uncharacterized protein n=1 Tax=Microbacterium telephonicum TaxID=1714841 RepID=A0A498CJB9_9MICO|nr:hypothetical protein C7474_0200 [Microbacterium telephonicum]
MPHPLGAASAAVPHPLSCRIRCRRMSPRSEDPTRIIRRGWHPPTCVRVPRAGRVPRGGSRRRPRATAPGTGPGRSRRRRGPDRRRPARTRGRQYASEPLTVISDAATAAEHAAPGHPADGVVWAQLADHSREDARPSWSFFARRGRPPARFTTPEIPDPHPLRPVLRGCGASDLRSCERRALSAARRPRVRRRGRASRDAGPGWGGWRARRRRSARGCGAAARRSARAGPP